MWIWDDEFSAWNEEPCWLNETVNCFQITKLVDMYSMMFLLLLIIKKIVGDFKFPGF